MLILSRQDKRCIHVDPYVLLVFRADWSLIKLETFLDRRDVARSLGIYSYITNNPKELIKLAQLVVAAVWCRHYKWDLLLLRGHRIVLVDNVTQWSNCWGSLARLNLAAVLYIRGRLRRWSIETHQLSLHEPSALAVGLHVLELQLKLAVNPNCLIISVGREGVYI